MSTTSLGTVFLDPGLCNASELDAVVMHYAITVPSLSVFCVCESAANISSEHNRDEVIYRVDGAAWKNASFSQPIMFELIALHLMI
jgi:hypothetical protein